MARRRTLRKPFDEAGTRALRDKRRDYMYENWWPDLLAHIPEECPWAASDVVVAEIRGFDDPSVPGVRFMWSALVPVAQLEALGGRLRAFGHEVESSGRPSPLLNGPQSLNPRFWIGTYLEGKDGAPSVREDYEPLILGWTSNNQTAMVLDPRFAMTYGLMPRVHVDGATRWDNPAEPEFDVASVDKPSLYADLRYDDMRAVVSRDYLQDYLSLREMALVQVFYEIRHGLTDKAAELALGTSQQLNEHLLTREIDVQRRREGGIARRCGARVMWRGLAISPSRSIRLKRRGLSGRAIQRPSRRALQTDFGQGIISTSAIQCSAPMRDGQASMFILKAAGSAIRTSGTWGLPAGSGEI